MGLPSPRVADEADKARKIAEDNARARGDDDGVAVKGEVAAKKAKVEPKAQRNFTDPDSRIMKTADGSYHYCYTGQSVVDDDHQVIIVNELNNVPVDVQQLVPMIEKTRETMGTHPGQVLIDAGYCSNSKASRDSPQTHKRSGERGCKQRHE